MAGVKKTEAAAGGQEMKTAGSTAKKKANAGKVKLIYIGPALPRAALKANSVFEGTKEEILQQLSPVLKKYPLAEKLLVPVKGLAEKKDKVKTAGNVLNKYYSDLASVISAAYGKGE